MYFMYFHRFPWIPLLLCLLLNVGQPALADDDGEWQDAGGGAPAAPAEEDAAAAAPPATPTTGPGGKPLTCVVTGLPWLESSTRVEAIMRVNGERLRGRFLSPAYMLIQYKLLQEEGSDVAIETVSVLDFASFGQGEGRMIAVAPDWSNIVFIATDRALPGSKEPYYAAFTTVEDIESALKTTPGKVLSYEAVMKRLLSALKSEDESDQVVESETSKMRNKFKGFDPTADPDEK